jgi:glucose-1-phosphate adenylyltransferase
MNDVLTIILGGGQGTRLFPLTHMRSKPAVPIGGKYRLIDIPISNCLHADLRRMFVLTQFNSASLNRHVAQTYRMDAFSPGFVDILAAEQTPDNPHWYQGTADAVRQARRHFEPHDADYYLILAGDHLYRMDFCQIVDDHIDRKADITIAAQPVAASDAMAMGIFRFDRRGHIVAFEEKPSQSRLQEIGQSIPPGSTFTGHVADKPFVASLGIYVFSRDVLLEMLEQPGIDFGREVIPAALGSRDVNAYLHRGYWADVGTVESFYDANLMLTRPGAPFTFYDPRRPIFTHPRFLPASRLNDCRVRNAIVADGCHVDEECEITESVVGVRTHVGRRARITRSVLLGADYYDGDDEARGGPPPLGIGGDAVLDRVIVDKNARIGRGARLTNEAGTDQADGAFYHIRNGIIIVPKGATVPDGAVV